MVHEKNIIFTTKVIQYYLSGLGRGNRGIHGTAIRQRFFDDPGEGKKAVNTQEEEKDGKDEKDGKIQKCGPKRKRRRKRLSNKRSENPPQRGKARRRKKQKKDPLYDSPVAIVTLRHSDAHKEECCEKTQYLMMIHTPVIVGAVFHGEISGIMVHSRCDLLVRSDYVQSLVREFPKGLLVSEGDICDEKQEEEGEVIVGFDTRELEAHV